MKLPDWVNSGPCTFVPNAGDQTSSCCVAHDRAYEIGGHPVSRKQADLELRRCVAARGHPLLAWIGWALVRAFGWIFWKKS